MASNGIATKEPYNCVEGTEDTITLMVQWENESGSLGTSVHTSSWAAPAKVDFLTLFLSSFRFLVNLYQNSQSQAEVHSQQRFFYMGHKGEIRVDQAHRGYETATDENGYSSVNPLFMKYTPDAKVFFRCCRKDNRREKKLHKINRGISPDSKLTDINLSNRGWMQVQRSTRARPNRKTLKGFFPQ